MISIHLHSLFALRENTKANRFPFGSEILLPQGLVGTVVEEYAQGEAFEVEFSGDDGQAYAMLTLEAEKLILLHFELTDLAAAS